MRFLKITNGYPRLSDSALLVKGKVIIAAMTGNANFPTPTPTLASISALIDAFEAALEKAASGDRQAIAEKNQARETLINGLHLLGNYVLFTSANDEVVATSSGFKVAKTPEPRPPLQTPYGLTLENGVNRGELKLSFAKVQGAKSYQYEITQAPVTPASVWQQLEGTVIKTMFSNLESGKEYYCRVTAIGIKGQAVQSEAVSRIVL